MTDQPPKKNRHAKKATKEGGAVAGLAVLLSILMQSVRANHPDLPWDPSDDAVVVGTTTGALWAFYRWIRKRIKRRRQRHGDSKVR